MRSALVSLVVGMGVLIIAGMILLVYGLVQRNDNPDFKFFSFGSDTDTVKSAPQTSGVQAIAPPIAQSDVPAIKTGLGDIRMEIPAGSTVVDSTLNGQTILVRLKLANQSDRLLLINAANGTQFGSITLVPGN